MAISFPSSLDILTNPTPTTSMSGSLSHAGQHSDLNDAVEALQAKVGADSSAVTTSHDYKIADHASRLTTLEGASNGKILQVVNDLAGTFSTTSLSLTNTNASLTITPSSATSKILVLASVYASRNNTADQQVVFAINRDGSLIPSGGEARYTSAVANARHSVMLYNLDSPASTSALTYTLQMRVTAGTGYIELYHIITAMEVGE